MEKDIKQIIKDILFEEETTEDTSEHVEVFKEMAPQVEKPSFDEPSIKAEDVIYKKSAFIDLDSKNNKPVDYVSETKEVYEFSSNISPIFGPINNTNRDNHINSDISKEKTDIITNKPSDNHLDIVPSPIYGYASKEDFIEDTTEYNSYIDDELDVLKDREISLFDDFGDK